MSVEKSAACIRCNGVFDYSALLYWFVVYILYMAKVGRY
jgi:hypothetical protein